MFSSYCITAFSCNDRANSTLKAGFFFSSDLIGTQDYRCYGKKNLRIDTLHSTNLNTLDKELDWRTLIILGYYSRLEIGKREKKYLNKTVANHIHRTAKKTSCINIY